MTLCPIRSAAGRRSLKRGLLSPHGRIRRGPEGSSRKVDVRRRWDSRVEKITRTPYLEGMPITTDAATVHPIPKSPDGVSMRPPNTTYMLDPTEGIDLSLRRATLFLIVIGSITLTVGLGLSGVGGSGEYGYYQCVASSGAGCTSTGSNQYVT